MIRLCSLAGYSPTSSDPAWGDLPGYPAGQLLPAKALRETRKFDVDGGHLRLCRRVYTGLRDLGKSVQWPAGITSALPLGRKEGGGLLTLLRGWSRGILTSVLWTLCAGPGLPCTAQVEQLASGGGHFLLQKPVVLRYFLAFDLHGL